MLRDIKNKKLKGKRNILGQVPFYAELLVLFSDLVGAF
jgi:hypothetical protein